MDSFRKVVLFIATSLDGFIARENGSLDWLFAIEGEGDNGFTQFYQTIDTIVMGRGTYDYLMAIVEEYPHADQKTYIFSRQENRQDLGPQVEYVSEDIAGFVQKLKNQDGSNIWLVGGAELFKQYIKEKLVDEFIISLSPIILGKGIPLFNQNNPEIKLELMEQKRYGQFVQLHYLVHR
ncbi:dihydrofolate reductase family protein [Bacillus sp. sid0103]|uniref:dihydrofolate reductase family protein n=1 Tax=Bacillus sp. sid0103 TaxID=2856337 RepID=UPI001C466145|nr:dihydrofolate reductase family protein [Bacillus sp. sid0103]MBV7506586.1 dihydrofolate reductase family protein [Bacillus sp. sid0103]